MSYKITFSTVAVEDIGKMSNEIYNACLDKKTTEEYVSNLLKKINEKTVFPETGIPVAVSLAQFLYYIAVKYPQKFSP